MLCVCFFSLQVKFNNDSHFTVCFKNKQNETPQDCVSMESGETTDNVIVKITTRDTLPGSDVHKALTNITSTSKCFINFTFIRVSSYIVSPHQFHVFFTLMFFVKRDVYF